MAVIKVEWTVGRLTNVMSQFDVQKVYRSITGEFGVYSEITDVLTRVPLVADQVDYFYDDVAGDPSYWYKISYYHSVSTLEGDLSDAFQVGGGGNYATIQDMRDEGVTDTQATDAKLLRLIGLAESYLERMTGRWFYPRYIDNMRLDGSGSKHMGIDPEIIQVDGLEMLWEPYGLYQFTSIVDLEGVVVYNRHLTQGLITPDDREDPKVVIEQYAVTEQGRWPKGQQNIMFVGWFGYTELGKGDPVGETDTGSQIPLSKGRTPPMIIDAVKRLVVRYLPEISDMDAVNDIAMAHRLQRMKTRDQEIQWSASGGSRGGGIFTGDRFIDDVIGAYMKPAGASMV